MNIQLVESLVEIINSLSTEERQLLEEKLTHKSDWETIRFRILKRSQAIYERRGGKPFDPSIDEIIHQMREERNQQLMEACFPNEETP